MARITNPEKLDNIKQVIISAIVEKGYGGACIAEIAKKAGVADGYLYRHYQSKYNLVHDLFYESLSQFFNYLREELEAYTTFAEFVKHYNLGLVEIFNKNTDKAKFFIQLINDYSFAIDKQAQKFIFDLCQQTLERGLRNKELPDDCSVLDIYTIMVIIPLQTFSLYLKGFFGEITLNEETANMVTRTCLKLIKKVQ